MGEFSKLGPYTIQVVFGNKRSTVQNMFECTTCYIEFVETGGVAMACLQLSHGTNGGYLCNSECKELEKEERLGFVGASWLVILGEDLDAFSQHFWVGYTS